MGLSHTIARAILVLYSAIHQQLNCFNPWHSCVCWHNHTQNQLAIFFLQRTPFFALLIAHIGKSIILFIILAPRYILLRVKLRRTLGMSGIEMLTSLPLPKKLFFYVLATCEFFARQYRYGKLFTGRLRI